MPVYLAWFDGQYERGLEASRRGLAAHPHVPGWIWHIAWSLAHLRQVDEAIAQVDQLAGLAPGHVHTKLALMLKHGLRGDVASAHAELTPEFRDWCFREGMWSYATATSFALANAKDDAMEWLAHAVDLGCINYPLLAEKDALLGNIRGDPRFEALLVRVKREWRAFEV